MGFLSRLFGWGKKSPKKMRTLEIIQPPLVDESQRPLASWAVGHIRRVDKDVFNLREEVEKNIDDLRNNQNSKIERLESSVQGLSRVKDPMKSISDLMYKKGGEENPSIVAPLEGVFNKLVQKVVDMRLAAENKRFLRMRVSTLAGVVFIVGVGLGALYFLNKTTSYDQNLSTIKGDVKDYTAKVDQQQKQYLTLSKSVSSTLSGFSSNLEYRTGKTHEEVNSFRDAVRDSNGRMNQRISSAERGLYQSANNSAQIFLDIDELKESQNNLEDSLAIGISDLVFNQTEYQRLSAIERARLERTVQDLSNQVFKIEEKYSTREEQFLKQLKDISVKYQKLEERLKERDNQATNSYQE